MSESNSQQRHTARWVALGAILIALAGVFLFANSLYVLLWTGSFPHYLDFLKYAAFPSGERPAPQSRNSAQLNIDFGNGKIRAFKGEVETGMTIISALRIAGEIGRFDAVTDERGRVVDIDGFKIGDAKRWQAYVNNRPASDLPGHIEIKPGDKITLRYE